MPTSKTSLFQSTAAKIFLGGLALSMLLGIYFLFKLQQPNIAITKPSQTLVPAEVEAPQDYKGQFATTLTVTGEASFTRDANTFALVPNTTLIQSDAIKTGPRSTASLLLGDGSVVRLNENTSIQLSTYTKTENTWEIRLKQFAGTTWNRVQKLAGVSKYEIETSTTVATVRGTAFSVDVSDDSAQVDVAEGTVTAKLVDTDVSTTESLLDFPVQALETTKFDKKDVTDAKEAKKLKKDIKKALAHTIPKKIPKANRPQWMIKNLEEDTKIEPFIEKIKQDLLTSDKNTRLQAVQQLRVDAGLPLPALSPTDPNAPLSPATKPDTKSSTILNDTKLGNKLLAATPTPTPTIATLKVDSTLNTTKLLTTLAPTPTTATSTNLSGSTSVKSGSTTVINSPTPTQPPLIKPTAIQTIKSIINTPVPTPTPTNTPAIKANFNNLNSRLLP